MSKRKAIDLKTKFLVVEALERGDSRSNIYSTFNLKPDNVSKIIKNCDKIKEEYLSSVNSSRKKLRKANHSDIEEACLKWFSKATQNNISISGPIIKAQALKFASDLGYSDFTASEGWLARFKARNDISFVTLCGEGKDVSEECVSDWVSNKLPDIISSYKPSDIYNCDETGIFFRFTPKKTLQFKGESCKGGKMNKERVTVLVFANCDGTDKRKLEVIGKSARPRCFPKNLKSLPVKYHSNRKAWMTGDLFQQIIERFNREMKSQNRSVLLFIDNCSAHPSTLKFSNVKIIFLPPNTTSALQPMDQGVIRSLKAAYRRQLVLKQLDLIETNMDPDSNKINILDAIHMLSRAWDEVKPSTIINCFRSCGFVFDGIINSSNEAQEDSDFLWNAFSSVADVKDVNFDDYVEIDNSVETYEEIDDVSIVEEILTRKSLQSKELVISSGEESDTEEIERITFLQAKHAINTLRKYCSQNISDTLIYKDIDSIESKVENERIKNPKQVPINSFLTKK